MSEINEQSEEYTFDTQAEHAQLLQLQRKGKIIVNKFSLLQESILVTLIKLLNYSMMLVAMTYNFWLILAMCLGLAGIQMAFDLKEDRKTIEALKIK